MGICPSGCLRLLNLLGLCCSCMFCLLCRNKYTTTLSWRVGLAEGTRSREHEQILRSVYRQLRGDHGVRSLFAWQSTGTDLHASLLIF